MNNLCFRKMVQAAVDSLGWEQNWKLGVSTFQTL